MVVKVTGKEYVKGTSKKTGKPFEGNVVYVVFQQRGVEGLKADTIWLDPVEYPLGSIEVGKDYNVDRDFKGWLIGFTKA